MLTAWKSVYPAILQKIRKSFWIVLFGAIIIGWERVNGAGLGLENGC